MFKEEEKILLVEGTLIILELRGERGDIINFHYIYPGYYSPALKVKTKLKKNYRRYQQTLVGCRKINKHVSFPLILDLAPFCSSTSLAMPIMQPHQPKVCS